MSRTAKKSAPDCSAHTFTLTPLRSDLYLKQVVSLSYCKSKVDAKNKPTGRRTKVAKNSCLCCPVYNKDRNHATSTFILPEDQQNYIENQCKFRLEHECRLREYSGEKSELLQPKPKTKQYYCNVCRNNYEDYLTHIESSTHKISIRKSPFNRYIQEIEAKYDLANQGRNSQPKNSFNSDTTQIRLQDEPEVEAMGMPSKKSKRDNYFTPAFCFPVGIPTLTMVSDNVQYSYTQAKIQQSATGFSPMAYPMMMPQGGLIPMQAMQMLKMMPFINQAQMYMHYSMQANMMMGYPFMYQNCFPSYGNMNSFLASNHGDQVALGNI